MLGSLITNLKEFLLQGRKDGINFMRERRNPSLNQVFSQTYGDMRGKGWILNIKGEGSLEGLMKNKRESGVDEGKREGREVF
jgi:hypothetical protein